MIPQKSVKLIIPEKARIISCSNIVNVIKITTHYYSLELTRPILV